MSLNVRAGIDFNGSILRYAEVEETKEGFHLLRLGACDFDFDVADDLFGEAQPRHLGTVVEALADVFAGSEATQLNLALHPPTGYSFLTPLSADADSAERDDRLVQEIALVTADGHEADALHFTSEALHRETLPHGRDVLWHHVLALREPVTDRLGEIFRLLPYPSHRLATSMQAAAAAMTLSDTGSGSGFQLALGFYGSFVEYVIERGGKLRFSHYAEPSHPADAAFFAATLLGRIGIGAADLDAVNLYGTRADLADPAVLEAVFRQPSRKMDPMALVAVEADSLPADFEAEAYVPCVGAALEG